MQNIPKRLFQKKTAVLLGLFFWGIVTLLSQVSVALAAPNNTIYANEFVDAKKQIDYLGDGETNNDTTLRGEDFYRLYMDVEGTTVYPAMDVTLVVDTSASMGRYNLGNRSRIQGLRDVLLGTWNNTGIIDLIYQINSDNRISIKSYGPRGASHTGLVNKNNVTYLKNQVPSRTSGGTNIEDGLYYANQEVTAAEKANKKRKQITILLSDGQPTHFNAPIFAPFLFTTFEGGPYTLTIGNGSSSFFNLLLTRYPTIFASNKFKRLHPEMDLYTIYIANQAEFYSDKGVMDKIASNSNFSFNAYDMDALRETLMKCLGIMEDIYITDELSEYVDYHVTKDDLKVTIKRPNGRTSVLTNREYEIVSKPKGKGDKKLQIKINNGLEIDAVYTVSYNISLSEKAKAAVDHSKEGLAFYGSGGRLGDKNTDYGTNKTSSNQPGFPSNKKANITWSRPNNKGNLENYEVVYDHPVVQVKREKPTFKPKVSLTKQIDYLGDDDINPHTSVEGNGEYRLYLAVENTTDKPVQQVHPVEKITIIDNLSRNVLYNRGQPDLLVERVVNGQTTVVPENEYKFNITRDTVGIELTKAQPLNSKIIVSFNISINLGQSIAELESNGFVYPHTGDPATDYLNNVTSSNKPGFFSNMKSTHAKWSIDGETVSDNFPHPVAQVSNENSSTGDVTKSIASLNSARGNKDTDINDSNYIRVYADLNSKTEGNEKEVIPLIKARYQDEVSEYVELDQRKMDLKVTATQKGVTKPISEEDYKVTYDKTKLDVEFKKAVPNKGKVTVSYNLRVNNDDILEDWLTNGLEYPDIGDPNTDYGDGTSSSNQPGMAISKRSLFSWTEQLTNLKEVNMPMPVLQVKLEN